MGVALPENSETSRSISVPPDMASIYISDMLCELSKVATESGLDNLSSLLRATLAASKVDINDPDLDNPNLEYLD